MTSRAHPFRAFLCLLALVLVSPAVAQETAVSGRVRDASGSVLPGVIVELGGRTTITDEQGSYRFQGIAAGAAELTFKLINFSVVRRTVEVTGSTVIADVVLNLALSADIVVTGAATFRNLADVPNPAENLLGIASSASQGAITAAQLEGRPIMRAGEVLESVPGLVVSQHSGEGKANQYYLRGFNLDHGTDFSLTVAGMPVNTPTGAHAHGYADASFLIPELVSGVQFRKGPYFAADGDFSAAGAANVNYVSQLLAPVVLVSTGSQGWERLFAAASPAAAGGHVLGGVELSRNDGPWLRPDGYQKFNGVLRYSRGDSRNGLSVTGLGYWADWDSTDQVPQRAIDAGVISRFGAIDLSDKGRADRQSLVLDLQRSSSRTSTRGTAYLLRNSLNLFSNFTFFLDDPEHGDQFEQAERRVAAGGRVTHRRLGRLFDRHVESAVGVQIRRDWLEPVGLYHTEARRRLSTTREDRVRQTMVGVYGQSELEWTRALRTTLGLRTDVYEFDVTSDNPANSGRGAAALVSPKFGAVFGPWAATEIYANAGAGFHSNDARGAVTRIDPNSGDRADAVTPLVQARGAEVGVRTVKLRGLQSTVSLWYLGLESELLFVGDAGTTEAGRPSRRVGVEWANYARLRPWLTIDGDLSFSRARFTEFDAAGNYVPGALDRVASGGITVAPARRAFGSLRVRHFGPRPLVEDASARSKGTTLWNLEAGYRASPRVRVVAEAFNVFDADVADIDYFYSSRLPGEPAEGIADIHTHPALPRTARIGLEVRF